ncbi:MAG: hypothetical protein GY717_08090 [Rhodobacteraceae bacterium]|nr:hypothetical protein [Paracoccaceae bacterium]
MVVGIILVGLSVPSILGAIADRRSPRVAAITILVGGTLILLALSQKPGGYTLQEVPEAFVRVVAHYFR